MPRYAKVHNGQVVETIELEQPMEPGTYATRGPKPYWLPLVDGKVPAVDPVTEKMDESYVVEKDRVVRTFTMRQLTAEEVEGLRFRRGRAIDREFTKRWRAPIDYMGNAWHADEEAILNISNTLFAYSMGEGQFPRMWTPKGQLDGVTLTLDEFKGLAFAMTRRKNALHAAKKRKERALAAASTAREIADISLTDW